MKNIFQNPNSKNSGAARRGAFTLVELLVVISIIAVIAGFTLVAVRSTGRVRKISVAQGELKTIEAALENYHAKYSVYPPGNQNPVNTYSPIDRALFSQLYYELSGTTVSSGNFITLDGSSSIPVNNPGKDIKAAYGLAGFINCSKGGGEEVAAAKNFLSGISPKQLYIGWTNPLGGASTTILVTSVGGPDDNYFPMNPVSGVGPNPIRYVYPGTNNVGSYDLWVELVINGKTNLVCNWSKSAIINSSMP